jgi:NAD+ kinase
VTTVGLFVHGGRADARTLGAEVATWLEAGAHEVVLAESDADLLGVAGCTPDADGLDLDLVVAIGGDGTVLRAARRAVAADAAILGLNLGELGYLAEVEPAGWQGALTAVLAGEHLIEERMMVFAQADTGPALPAALNEVVIEKQAVGRTVRLGVTIDGGFFTSYVCDGIILATPTGSTAYSLSARGPIVAPSHRALILTPVSPHTLFDRSLVLGPESVVRVQVLGDREAVISLDGQVCDPVPVGTTVTIRAADRPARFVTFGGRNFHQILKAKFGLSDR